MATRLKIAVNTSTHEILVGSDFSLRRILERVCLDMGLETRKFALVDNLTGLVDYRLTAADVISRQMNLTLVPAEQASAAAIPPAILEAVQNLRSEAAAAGVDPAVSLATLKAIVGNIQASSDPKFRTLTLENPALQTRLLRFTAARQALIALGFEEIAEAPRRLVCSLPGPRPEWQSAINLLDSILKAPAGSVILPPTTSATAAAASPATSPASTEMESKAAAEPSISEVRRSVMQLKSEVLSLDSKEGMGTFRDLLDLLISITSNLLKSREVRYRCISLSNPLVKSTFGGFEGALAYLQFLGFRKEGDGDEAQLVMKEESDARSERALGVLKRLLEENKPTPEESLKKQYPEALLRDLRVLDMTLKPVRAAAPELDEKEEALVEKQLLLQDMRQTLMHNALFHSKDVLVSREKLEEIKQARAPIFDRVVVRVSFDDRLCIQAYFRPYETLGDVMTEIRPFLNDETKVFSLCMPLREKFSVQDQDKSLMSVKLVPSAILHFKWNDGASSVGALKAEWAARKEQPQGDYVPAPVNQQNIDQFEARLREKANALRRLGDKLGGRPSDDDMSALRQFVGAKPGGFRLGR